MGSGSSRSVEIQISNKTTNIILKEPRTFVIHGCCSKPTLPELFPRSSDNCSFVGDSGEDLSGILVYEADSFTLAIYFSNPIDYNKFPMELGLELSPGKAHRYDLRATHRRMAHGTYSSADRDIEFARVTVGNNHGTARLSHGPVKVAAAMSYATSSTLKVMLEEQ